MNQDFFEKIARSVWIHYIRKDFSQSYTTILALYAGERLAEETGDEILRQQVLGILDPFLTGRIDVVGGYYGENLYRFGGNAGAYAVHRKWANESAASMMCHAADLLITRQPRYTDGTFCQRKWHDPSQWGFRWIDTVFGVCPFLLWTGLDSGRTELIDEAVFQMKNHYELLFDLNKKLYHQAMDACRPEITPGYWSRGMGWAMHALVDLAAELPDNHATYGFIQQAYREAVDGCVASQDANGVWHQSMNDFGTFVETSGTGLILYAVGKGLRYGLLEQEKYYSLFEHGIAGLSEYICLDGSVQNCCGGCCSPGYNGTASDYDHRGWILNDPHAFGPVILAFTEAFALAKNSKKGVKL